MEEIKKTAKKTAAAEGAEAVKPVTKKPAAKKDAAATEKKTVTKKPAAKKDAAAAEKKPVTKKLAAKKPAKAAEEQRPLDPANSPDDLMKIITSVLSERKADDIIAIDVAEKTVIADYFVIASGRSTTSVNALAARVDEKLSKEYGIEPLRREGTREGRWIAVDYGSVIVHIFHEETRKFYQLERLWTEKSNVVEIL